MSATRMPRYGWRPTNRARSRSSGAERRPGRCLATTTRWFRYAACYRQPARRMKSGWTANSRGHRRTRHARPAGSGRWPTNDPCGSRLDPVVTQVMRPWSTTSTSRRIPWRAWHANSPRTATPGGPTRSSCSAIRCTGTRPPRRHDAASAPAATSPPDRASRSPTSRSTPGCITNRGPIPTCGGFCRPCQPR